VAFFSRRTAAVCEAQRCVAAMRTDFRGHDGLKSIVSIATHLEKTKSNQLLQGISEFITPKEKICVKNHLIEEVIFMLKNYILIYQNPR
ncbi:MAG: hypothetical protein LBL17_00760, partial [Coxiellaceae bacterium]|nr:hypothetical protein [Coxiellaceae bacterium]